MSLNSGKLIRGKKTEKIKNNKVPHASEESREKGDKLTIYKGPYSALHADGKFDSKSTPWQLFDSTTSLKRTVRNDWVSSINFGIKSLLPLVR